MSMSSMLICEVSKEPSFSRQANLAETQQSIEPYGHCTADAKRLLQMIDMSARWKILNRKTLLDMPDKSSNLSQYILFRWLN